MEKEYANSYRELYQNHWWWRAREKAILEEIDRLGFETGNSLEILDVGCGDGLLFEPLSRYGQVWGVEADPETLTDQNPWRERIFQQPFDASFQPGRKFDLILMLDLLEHLEYPATALRHARSLLKPGGKLLITVPAFKTLWTTHDDLNHHFVRYTRPTFMELATAAGVALDKLNYLYHWTCPIKLAIRLKEQWFDSQAAPPVVPHRIVNSICFALSRFEQLTLSRIGMPFGSSLLAVGTAADESGQQPVH